MRYLSIVVAFSGLMVAAVTRPPVAGLRSHAGSPCSCVGCHGSYRVRVKDDTAQPPAEIPRDHQVTPSDVAAWPGPGGVLHEDSPRSGRELEWFRVTGRLVARKLEADGDLHLQLIDQGANASEAVQLIVEIPIGPPWCAMRRDVIGLRLRDRPLVVVEGRAFYDAEHAVGADTKANRRPCLNGARCAIWEVHPAMSMARPGPS